jgi:hypothetical protein
MPSIEPAMTGRQSSHLALRHSHPLPASWSNWRSKCSGTLRSRPGRPFAVGFNVLTVTTETIT